MPGAARGRARGSGAGQAPRHNEAASILFLRENHPIPAFLLGISKTLRLLRRNQLRASLRAFGHIRPAASEESKNRLGWAAPKPIENTDPEKRRAAMQVRVRPDKEPAGERSLAMLLAFFGAVLVFDIFWWLRR